MRLASFVAPTTQQAMADLRASLGDDAIIVTTQTLADGHVRITGAVAQGDLPIADVLTPQKTRVDADWLTSLAAFHELSDRWCQSLAPGLESLTEFEPDLMLGRLLCSIYQFENSLTVGDKPILLSGPPGGGKTVTTAKLAARAILAGESVDVLTMDVRRAGGLEQLTALLAPLERQPIVVPTPADLPQTLIQCSGDLVLIDSPGINPFDPTDLGTLSAAIDHTDVELVLVLAAGASPADSAEIGKCYATLGAGHLLVTKLDVTRRLGGILAAAEPGLMFCDAGIGPTIGDGLRPLTADGLARLLLHRYRTSVDEGMSP